MVKSNVLCIGLGALTGISAVDALLVERTGERCLFSGYLTINNKRKFIEYFSYAKPFGRAALFPPFAREMDVLRVRPCRDGPIEKEFIDSIGYAYARDKEHFSIFSDRRGKVNVNEGGIEKVFSMECYKEGDNTYYNYSKNIVDRSMFNKQLPEFSRRNKEYKQCIDAVIASIIDP